MVLLCFHAPQTSCFALEVLTVENKSPSKSCLQITWGKTEADIKRNLNVGGLVIQRKAMATWNKGLREEITEVLGKFPLVLMLYTQLGLRLLLNPRMFIIQIKIWWFYDLFKHCKLPVLLAQVGPLHLRKLGLHPPLDQLCQWTSLGNEASSSSHCLSNLLALRLCSQPSSCCSQPEQLCLEVTLTSLPCSYYYKLFLCLVPVQPAHLVPSAYW